MFSDHHVSEALPGLCRSLLQSGMGLVLQSTLLLGLGMLAGRALRRRGPALASLIYRVSLTGALPGALAEAASYNLPDTGLPAAPAAGWLGNRGQGQGVMLPGGGAPGRHDTGASVGSSGSRPGTARPWDAGRLGWLYVGIVDIWAA